MKRRGRLHRGLAIAMALMTNGCYTFAPRGPAVDLPLDARVAARLTTRASADYVERLGPDVDRVDGTIARVSGDSVELRVLRTRNRDGDWAMWSGEPVTFGVNDFSAVGERRFSRSRTFVAAGAMIAAVVLILTSDLFGLGGEGSSEPRPIPPENPG